MAQQVERNNGGTTNDARFPTIYKLSDNDGYLMPSDVSMGPYRRRTSFLCREAEKRNHLTRFLSKFAAVSQVEEDLESYLLRKIDEKLRSSAGPLRLSTSGGSLSHGQIVYYDDMYYDDIHLPRHQGLAKILLLDGCYLVVNFVDMDQVMSTTTRTSSSSQEGGGGGGGSSTTTTSTADDVPHSGPLVRDTWYLLQNQIPFFVLEEICTGVTGCTAEVARTEFTSYARQLLCNQKMLYYDNTQPPAPAPPGDVFHLLHLLHTLLIEPLNNSPAAGAGTRRSSGGTNDADDGMFQLLRRTFPWCFMNNEGAPGSGQVSNYRLELATYTH